ncbi:MAG: hypothetical protein QNK23_11685 [Crocinitomicaceae bacterium]|nr:hypothetical protein [Crocinitomicaceae bacterium]
MKTFVILIGLFLVVGSCVKNNPDPAWIEVTDWQLEVNPNSPIVNQDNYPGILTENISDAWVYINSELIGVFELPFKIPVLYEGDVEITIYPAVLNNGISATKKIYPFLSPYVINTNLVKNEIHTFTPATHYYETVNFEIIDFEGSFAILDGSGLASLNSSSDPSVLDPAINGSSFGRILLDETDSTYTGSTVINAGVLNMDLPSGTEVYLEIDYHNTSSITAGVISVESTGGVDNPHVRINAQDPSEVRWKKIYLDLRDIVSGSPNAQYFEFSFQAILDDGLSSGEINIDNIKAVYF